MKNKYIRLRAMLLAGTITLTSMGLSGCSSKDNSNDVVISGDQVISVVTEEKEFGIGEHIISVPIKTNLTKDNYQLEYHEGYEVVGITTNSNKYGFLGSCILYVNTQPVKCSRGENGYTTFGIPIENDQVKTLK